MDGASTSRQAAAGSFSRVAIALPIRLIVVVVFVALADSNRGVTGALVVGVVWGSFVVTAALLRKRFVTWIELHLVVDALIMRRARRSGRSS